MATDTVLVDGTGVKTLRELVKPGLRAVVVGINPSPVSVKAGHYYQGNHGRRLWRRLEGAGIVRELTPGREDDTAFAQGIGFADLVRRPTSGSSGLSTQEKARAVPDLGARLEPARGAVILAVYADVEKFAGEVLRELGWRVERLPGPYESTDVAQRRLRELAQLLGGSR